MREVPLVVLNDTVQHEFTGNDDDFVNNFNGPRGDWSNNLLVEQKSKKLKKNKSRNKYRHQ